MLNDRKAERRARLWMPICWLCPGKVGTQMEKRKKSRKVSFVIQAAITIVADSLIVVMAGSGCRGARCQNRPKPPVAPAFISKTVLYSGRSIPAQRRTREVEGAQWKKTFCGSWVAPSVHDPLTIP